MAYELDFQRQHPQDEVQVGFLWTETFTGIAMNGVAPRVIAEHFGLNDDDIAQRITDEPPGLHLDLRRLGLRLFDLRTVANAVGSGMEPAPQLLQFADLVDPSGFIDNAVLAIHMITRLAQEAGVAQKLSLGRYEELALKQANIALLGKTHSERHGGVAEGFSAIQNRLVSVDLVHFKGK